MPVLEADPCSMELIGKYGHDGGMIF